MYSKDDLVVYIKAKELQARPDRLQNYGEVEFHYGLVNPPYFGVVQYGGTR